MLGALGIDADELVQWEQDCRAEMQVQHENEVFLKIVLLANIVGYQHAAYGLEYPTSVAAPSFSFFANYAPDWQEKFVVRHAKHHGSRVAYGKRVSAPIVGSRPYYWTREDFTREAQAHNITIEWFENSIGRGGTTALFGLSSFSGVDGPMLRKKTHILIRTALEEMENRLLEKNLPQLFVTLSDQERNYLCWVLDGKTSGEIADIMEISKASVENMQRKLPERFDRNGIFATAFFAYRLGLLTAV